MLLFYSSKCWRMCRMGHPRQRKFMIYEIEHAMAKLDTEDAPRKSFIGNLKHRLTGDLRPAGDSKTGIVIRPSFLRAAKNTKVEDSNPSSSDSSSSSSSEGDDESSDDEKEASKNTKKKHHKTQVTSPIRKAFDRPSSSRVAPEI